MYRRVFNCDCICSGSRTLNVHGLNVPHMWASADAPVLVSRAEVRRLLKQWRVGRQHDRTLCSISSNLRSEVQQLT